MANNLLIAKNSVALYIRMLLSLIVSLYTSRIVLEALGSENFGVYNVVGGIIGFMGFINASLSGAISRFITFELGNKDNIRLRETFSSAFIINLILAFIIVVLAETIGLWFLNTKLSIPKESINAANWVYQFTIIGMFFSITQIPYTAIVIAHEKMKIYAYVELIVVFLRLLMTYILLIINSNHLIWYSAIVTGINILMAVLYRLYCIRNFKESSIIFAWKPNIIKPMLKFSGWDLFGNVCLTIRVQGLTMLINVFFGVVLNAAYGIATQVNNNVLSFSTNIITAYRPQIIKSYAMKAYNDYSRLISDGAKFSLIAMLFIVIPLCAEMDYILKIWLGNPPYMTNLLCKLALITSVIGSANYTINIGIQATGKVENLSLINGVMHLLIIIVSYCFLAFGLDAQWIFYISIFFNIMLLLSSLIILKRLVDNFNNVLFLRNLLMLFIISLISWSTSIFFKTILAEGFARLLLILFTSGSILALLSYFNLLSMQQRKKIQFIIQKSIFK